MANLITKEMAIIVAEQVNGQLGKKQTTWMDIVNAIRKDQPIITNDTVINLAPCRRSGIRHTYYYYLNGDKRNGLHQNKTGTLR